VEEEDCVALQALIRTLTRCSKHAFLSFWSGSHLFFPSKGGKHDSCCLWSSRI